jgi:hypothetical protein
MRTAVDSAFFYFTLAVTYCVPVVSASLCLLSLSSKIQRNYELVVMEIGAYVVATLLCWKAHVLTVRTHPGKVPRFGLSFTPNRSGLITAKQEQALDLAFPSRTRKKSTNGRRFCRVCKLWKPDRTHHCHACGTCSLRYDHHCAFVDNCVGLRNQKFFMLYLLYGSLACIIASFMLKHGNVERVLLRYGRGMSLCAMLIWILNVVFAITLALFLLYVLFLTFFGYTTLEFVEKRNTLQYDGKPYRHDYGVSFRTTLRQICGDVSMIQWLLPVRIRNPHNGLVWSLSNAAGQGQDSHKSDPAIKGIKQS